MDYYLQLLPKRHLAINTMAKLLQRVREVKMFEALPLIVFSNCGILIISCYPRN
jgi:hypothetical protein